MAPQLQFRISTSLTDVTSDSASAVGSSMVVADALDEAAAGFYPAHGFVRLPASLWLVLPMRMAAASAEQ
jgi:hypothetical protein